VQIPQLVSDLSHPEDFNHYAFALWIHAGADDPVSIGMSETELVHRLHAELAAGDVPAVIGLDPIYGGTMRGRSRRIEARRAGRPALAGVGGLPG
jgi:hypothetical protein